MRIINPKTLFVGLLVIFLASLWFLPNLRGGDSDDNLAAPVVKDLPTGAVSGQDESKSVLGSSQKIQCDLGNLTNETLPEGWYWKVSAEGCYAHAWPKDGVVSDSACFLKSDGSYSCIATLETDVFSLSAGNRALEGHESTEFDPISDTANVSEIADMVTEGKCQKLAGNCLSLHLADAGNDSIGTFWLNIESSTLSEESLADSAMTVMDSLRISDQENPTWSRINLANFGISMLFKDDRYGFVQEEDDTAVVATNNVSVKISVNKSSLPTDFSVIKLPDERSVPANKFNLAGHDAIGAASYDDVVHKDVSGAYTLNDALLISDGDRTISITVMGVDVDDSRDAAIAYGEWQVIRDTIEFTK